VCRKREIIKMNQHVKYGKNDRGRDFIIGDLHGCYDILQKAMWNNDFNENIDRLFSVGDLVDRGDKNVECARLLYEPWFHSVMGNHERMYIDAYDDGSLGQDGSVMGMYLHNGGNWSSQIDKETEIELLELFQKMPISITIVRGDETIGICHAEPPKDWDNIENTSESNLLWGRNIIKMNSIDVKNTTRTYHGHTPVASYRIIGNAYFIDTGAVFNGNLTMLEI
jgi:serine/threonine protein phosphatase 1